MAVIKVGSGSTPSGSTAWQVYNASGVYVDVNTSAALFGSTPLYFTSIGGNTSHWSTIGATSVYFPTPTGFRIYLRWVDYSPLTPATANQFQWHINWVGIEP